MITFFIFVEIFIFVSTFSLSNESAPVFIEKAQEFDTYRVEEYIS